jgi:membrane protein implicated in regulation of membrane protease activity
MSTITYVAIALQFVLLIWLIVLALSAMDLSESNTWQYGYSIATIPVGTLVSVFLIWRTYKESVSI